MQQAQPNERDGDARRAHGLRRLYLSPHTINNHLRSIYRKLNISSRRAAGRVAQEYQLF